MTTTSPRESVIGRLVREVKLLVVGVVTIAALFTIAVYTQGWAMWVGYVVIGLGLIAIARRVPVAPHNRVLVWLVAGTGTAMMLLGAFMAIATALAR